MKKDLRYDQKAKARVRGRHHLRGAQPGQHATYRLAYTYNYKLKFGHAA